MPSHSGGELQLVLSGFHSIVCSIFMPDIFPCVVYKDILQKKSNYISPLRTVSIILPKKEIGLV